MATVFAAPANNVSTTVGTSGYTSGAGSLNLAAGGGAVFLGFPEANSTA